MKKPSVPRSADKSTSTKNSPKGDLSKSSEDTSAKSRSMSVTELEDLDALHPDGKATGQTPVDAPADDDPSLEAHPIDDLALDDHPDEDMARVGQVQDDEHGNRTFAATALMILVGVLFIASLTLWAAPKLAPHLPAGLAKYLTPGQADTEGRIANLEETLTAAAAKDKEVVASLRTKVAALTGRVDTDAEGREARQADITAARSAAESATTDIAELSARLDSMTTEITVLRDEFSAVSTALTEVGNGEGAAAPEIAAAVAALSARLDSLAASVEDGTAAKGLESRIAALEARLEDVETSSADAREVQTEALGEASTAVRQARLQSAIDLLSSRLADGQSYADKLDEIATLSGAEPPAPLVTGASNGLVSTLELEADFARHAQAAISADVQASTGGGAGLQALGWLRSQVAGRPTTEQEGDYVGAITSRIEARLGEGKLAEALSESETLPEHSQAALGSWLDQLRNRVDAEAALADWRTQIGIGG